MNYNYNETIKKLQKFLKNKGGRLHDPIFFGNEIKYLKKCIDTGFVSYVGKFVDKFEKKICYYTKSKYAVATSSGTAALHLILNYIKTGKNDEVLLPGYTYVATANAIKYCNATPNFLDIEAESLGVCPSKLEDYLKKISIKKKNKTFNKFTKKQIKALIVVHVYGFPCKILEIKRICSKYNIHLIEDAAEAVGSFFMTKHLGTFSDFGILSFNGNKTITTGGGGAILVKKKNTANQLKHLSTHAKLKIKFDHYHDKIGFNYRMINLAAAVGCAQLENLRKILIAKRKIFRSYVDIFKNTKDIKVIKEPKNSKTNYWLITILFANKKIKEKFKLELKKKKIGLRYTWRPLKSLKIFKDCPSDNLTNSKNIFERTLNLPSSPNLHL